MKNLYVSDGFYQKTVESRNRYLVAQKEYAEHLDVGKLQELRENKQAYFNYLDSLFATAIDDDYIEQYKKEI